jgi:hypothetical protein
MRDSYRRSSLYIRMVIDLIIYILYICEFYTHTVTMIVTLFGCFGCMFSCILKERTFILNRIFCVFHTGVVISELTMVSLESCVQSSQMYQ